MQKEKKKWDEVIIYEIVWANKEKYDMMITMTND